MAGSKKKLAIIPHSFDLQTTDSGKLLWNSQEVNQLNFKDLIQQTARENSDYYIRYLINENSTFADYTFIVTTIMQALYELRDEYALENYQEKYDDLDDEQAAEVRQKFPYRVVEIFNPWQIDTSNPSP